MPLGEILIGFWRWRRLLVLLVLALWALGGTAIFCWPRSHVARAVVAPAETTSFAVSALLAPHAGPLNASPESRPIGNFAVYLGALRSPEAAWMLTTETAILADLTERRRAWPLGPILQLLGLERLLDADDVLEWLERHFAVTQNLTSVNWTLEIGHRNPALALAVLQKLHRFAEAKVRADLAEQATRRVTALEARLAAESDLFLRNSLYDLLAQQQRAGLVVAADEAVAARLVASPMVEARASRPNRPLFLGLLLLLAPAAVLFGAAGVLLARAEIAGAGAITRQAAWQGD